VQPQGLQLLPLLLQLAAWLSHWEAGSSRQQWSAAVRQRPQHLQQQRLCQQLWHRPLCLTCWVVMTTCQMVSTGLFGMGCSSQAWAWVVVRPLYSAAELSCGLLELGAMCPQLGKNKAHLHRLDMLMSTAPTLQHMCCCHRRALIQWTQQ
jgi:hypothetical protein